MPQLVYVGPYSAVDVPDFGINVNRDEPFEATPEQVEALGGQACWNVISDPAPVTPDAAQVPVGSVS